MIRARLRERADQAIERTNQRFGGREGRKQALKKQVETFPLLNAKAVRGLLDSVLVRFPKDPVPTGGSWEAPVTPVLSTPFDMTAAHTLKGMTADACTIEIMGRRTMQDPPIVSQAGSTQTATKLAGTYTATAKVDPRTGLVLGKHAQIKFTGEAQSPARQGKSETIQTTMEGTTTVEAVE